MRRQALPVSPAAPPTEKAGAENSGVNAELWEESDEEAAASVALDSVMCEGAVESAVS